MARPPNQRGGDSTRPTGWRPGHDQGQAVTASRAAQGQAAVVVPAAAQGVQTRPLWRGTG